MKILFNATTAIKGGALHLSTMLIREALQDRHEHQWCFAISSVVARELEGLLAQETTSWKVFDRSPARSTSHRRDLARLETEFQPDAVLTPYGPAYVRFTAPHLLGVAVPWVTHPSLIAYRTLDFPHEWIKRLLVDKHKSIWYRRASAWWVETECARQGLMRRLGLPGDWIGVIPNTCAAQYRQCATRRPFPDSAREIKLLYFTAPYKHKNLNMVPRVAKVLVDRQPNLRFRMVTTLPEDHVVFRRMMKLARSLGVTERIDNRGPIRVADGPRLYQECDICFMPTVLEVFSATYPEAMAMGLPIVTSDLGFARDICGKAASFFLANQPTSAADAILGLLESPSQWNELVEEGKHVLSALPTPPQKFGRYTSLLSDLVEGRPFPSGSPANVRESLSG